MVRRGVIQRCFLLFVLFLQLLFNPLCFQFEMLSFLLASACNELQISPAAHTEECPSGVEEIIKMPRFSSRPVFVSKAPPVSTCA